MAINYLGTLAIVSRELIVPIIVTLVVSCLLFLMRLLPPSLQLHKKILFLLQVKTAIWKISVSTKTATLISPSRIESLIPESAEQFSDFRKVQGGITLNSYKSGTSYKITSYESDDGAFFIGVENFGGMSTGIFGRPKNVDVIVNECQKIAESFRDLRQNTDKVTIEIKIVPRVDLFLSSKLTAENSKKLCSLLYGSRQIRLIQHGFSNLKDTIRGAFYEWMISFV